jgi:hypothetical protein
MIKYLLYFILRIRIVQSLNLNFESNRFESIKGFIKEKGFLSPNILSGRFPATGPANQAFFSNPRLPPQPDLEFSNPTEFTLYPSSSQWILPLFCFDRDLHDFNPSSR